MANLITNKCWLKLIGVAFLLHIALIIISILEVTIYSYLIDPGKDEVFYQTHAEITGPWISGIIGSILIFLIVRKFIQQRSGNYLTYTIGLPIVYIVMDIVMLLPFHINWNDHFPVFLFANGVKVASSFLSYFIYTQKI